MGVCSVFFPCLVTGRFVLHWARLCGLPAARIGPAKHLCVNHRRVHPLRHQAWKGVSAEVYIPSWTYLAQTHGSRCSVPLGTVLTSCVSICYHPRACGVQENNVSQEAKPAIPQTSDVPDAPEGPCATRSSGWHRGSRQRGCEAGLEMM